MQGELPFTQQDTGSSTLPQEWQGEGARQHAEQEVEEGLAALALGRQLAVRQARAEGVRADDVAQARVLEVALPRRRLAPVQRLELRLAPQLRAAQRALASSCCSMADSCTCRAAQNYQAGSDPEFPCRHAVRETALVADQAT